MSDALSRRELEVLRLASEGLTAEQTGRELYISAKTVKQHRASIMTKLETPNMVSAVALSIRVGVI